MTPRNLASGPNRPEITKKISCHQPEISQSTFKIILPRLEQTRYKYQDTCLSPPKSRAWHAPGMFCALQEGIQERIASFLPCRQLRALAVTCKAGNYSTQTCKMAYRIKRFWWMCRQHSTTKALVGKFSSFNLTPVTIRDMG